MFSPVSQNQWWIQGRGRAPPLFLDQNEAQRAKKMFLRPSPPPLSQSLDDRPIDRNSG